MGLQISTLNVQKMLNVFSQLAFSCSGLLSDDQTCIILINITHRFKFQRSNKALVPPLVLLNLDYFLSGKTSGYQQGNSCGW